MTSPFSIDRDIDGPDLTITVTMTGAIERFLDLLTSHDGIQYHVALLLDLPATSLHHGLARKALAANPAMIAAVTERLTPNEAELLSVALDEASLHTDPCTRCGNHLAEVGDLCGGCADDEGDARIARAAS
jgi:hypothetical protein